MLERSALDFVFSWRADSYLHLGFLCLPVEGAFEIMCSDELCFNRGSKWRFSVFSRMCGGGTGP